MYKLEQIYEDVLPELNILERKATPANKPTSHQADEPFKSKTEQIRNTIEPQSPNKRKNSIAQNDPDHPGHVHSKQEGTNRKTNPKFNNEASKNLITEMLNKISLRSVSEENYPISNQTIERLMRQLEAEINVLNVERDKFANSLLLNPSNQHLKKELQAMDKNLNQIKTIRDLYKEKIQYRNKISDLESKIMELKIENRELKIKIQRGIQKIESHIHNLPCEKQKELIEEVNKYREALQREKQMRINLQTNINSINLNFKRFYEEADSARKIVGQELKKIAAKQQELQAKVDKLNFHRCECQEQTETKSGTAFKRMATNRPNQEENIADAINMVNRQDTNIYKQSLPNELLRNNSNREAEGRVRSYTQQGFNDGTQKYKGKREDQMGPVRKGSEIEEQKTTGGFNLSEQIEKMRMNQAVFNKLNKKKM